jgi:arginase
MENKFILTPFFLDEPLPGLMDVAGPDWIVNQPRLSANDRIERVAEVEKALARQIELIVLSGRRPVSLAGDCLSAIGVLAGLQRAGLEPVLVWFDAHGDFNTAETTPSGFLGGMPLAMIAGRGNPTIVRAVGLEPLAESRIILTDARDLDPGERTVLAASAVVHLPNPRALLDRPLPPGPLYVHFDTDVVTPAEVPAQNYPAAGGLSSKELAGVFRHLSKSGRLAAASLSSWNPKLEGAGLSRSLSLHLLEALTSG